MVAKPNLKPIVTEEYNCWSGFCARSCMGYCPHSEKANRKSGHSRKIPLEMTLPRNLHTKPPTSQALRVSFIDYPRTIREYTACGEGNGPHLSTISARFTEERGQSVKFWPRARQDMPSRTAVMFLEGMKRRLAGRAASLEVLCPRKYRETLLLQVRWVTPTQNAHNYLLAGRRCGELIWKPI